MTNFPRSLKLIRESQRTSQSKLAERAGFDHSYVSRLESGARTPSREAVVRLAEALSLTDAERDNLLASAQFMPLIPTNLYQFPELSAIDRALGNIEDEAQLADALAALRLIGCAIGA